MRFVPAFLLIILLCLSACRDNVSTKVQASAVDETLTALMQEAMDRSYDQIPGISTSIISPHIRNKIWDGAVGYDSKKKEDKLTKEQPYRIASVTKTFVATAILRLHEMDSLSIDDPLSKHISKEHLRILTGGNYNLDLITIRHCLHHTSGLYDYAVGSQAYGEAIRSNPNRRWTRTDQLKGAVAWGDKVGEPGERYEYSDTGYILLGEIVENYFDGSLAEGLRRLVNFENLEMNSTWLETLEPSPVNMPEPVHRYFGRDDITTWDCSIDLYGGGGLMSTSRDLVVFMDALFSSKVFDKKTTLELMLSTTSNASIYDIENEKGHKDYRMGIYKIDMYGHEAYLHSGLWGVLVAHIPDLESSFAFNFTNSRSDQMIKKVILLIKNQSEL